jgi:hypothetical protein
MQTAVRLAIWNLWRVKETGKIYYYYYYCYYLTAVVLTPRIHLHTNSTQNTEDGTHITITRKKKTNTREKIGKCWPCPVFGSYTLAFTLQLRKKHGKTSVRVVEKCPDIPVAVQDMKSYGGTKVRLLWLLTFVPASRSSRFNPEESRWYQLNRRLGWPQTLSERCGKEKNLLPLPGIEPLFLGCPTHSLVDEVIHSSSCIVCFVESLKLWNISL